VGVERVSRSRPEERRDAAFRVRELDLPLPLDASHLGHFCEAEAALRDECEDLCVYDGCCQARWGE